MSHTATKLSKKHSQRMAPPVGPSPLLPIMDEDALRGRDILGISELSQDEMCLVLKVAHLLKVNKFDETQTSFTKGQTLAMVFEKPSLRTRVTFEAGMIQLGGSAIPLDGKLGERESVADVAHNLDRWLDGIMARVFDHSTLIELAANADIPVINGLSDLEHPCQALADLLTIQEHKGEYDQLKVAYVGDGNNVANSLALAAAKVGMEFVVAYPKGYEPDEKLWRLAQSEASFSKAKLWLTNQVEEAVAQADVVYTDTWVSMGQEADTQARVACFSGFQVNADLMAHAKKDAIVMHCLPAHRGQEITDEVMDGPQSVVFDQAENRLHVQKALLSLIL